MTVIDDRFKKELGKRLKILRKEKGLTQAELVEKLSTTFHIDIDEKSVRRYENGTYLPKIDNLIALSEFFGTSLDFLVYGKEMTDENSYTWKDTFRRLNRLIFSAVLLPFREEDKNSPYCGKYYFEAFDEEVTVYMERFFAYAKDKCYSFETREKSPYFDISDLDRLVGNFEDYTDDLSPSAKRLDHILKLSYQDPEKYTAEAIQSIKEKRAEKNSR